MLSLVSTDKCSRVDVHSLCGNGGCHRIKPSLLVKANVCCGITEHYGVEDLTVSKLKSYLLRVDRVGCVVLLKTFNYIFGVLLCADNDGHRIDAAVVYDDNAVLLKEVRVSERLKSLKGDDNVCLPFLNDGLVDLLSKSYEGNYASASLSHSVDLGDLYVVALRESGFSH